MDIEAVGLYLCPSSTSKAILRSISLIDMDHFGKTGIQMVTFRLKPPVPVVVESAVSVPARTEFMTGLK